ncbi:hypothetical protein [Metabacillus fastidiosus]|uniref:SbsC C-terminal domain-containing protein n=1 Tax=Metabacillus fastidiosus TaxID=1458 RepID=A0ABU6P3K3_9BACI|nr:hypothetical protein [Metabacillus fastidiosus]
MSKKKIAKFGLTAAVAATTVVAATPADAASVSATEKAVKQAAQSAGALVKYYSSTDIKVSGEFVTANNNARKAIANAKAALAKYNGKDKAQHEATVAKAEGQQLDAARYIDAEKLVKGELVNATKAVDAHVKAQTLGAETVTAYNKLSDTIKKAERVIGKVRGEQVRKAFGDKFLQDAKLTREALIYEVSQYQLLNKIAEKVAKEDFNGLDAELAKLDRLKERAVAIKEAGRKIYPGRTDVYPELPKIEEQLRSKETELRDKITKASPLPAVASVKAINATTVEVAFKEEVKDIASVRFAIAGLDVKNAAVKQTDNKTVVITTSTQEGAKDYTVKAGESTLGKFKGVSAVIPSDIKVTTTSVQGVVGKEVTLKASIDKKEAGVPVTFNVDADNNSLNKDIVAEVYTDADGVATFTYTQYNGVAITHPDLVAVYATGNAAKRDFARVYWGVEPILTIQDADDKKGTALTNGDKKVYKVVYKDSRNGKGLAGKTINVTFAENVGVTADKLSTATIEDPNGVKDTPYQLSNGTLKEVTVTTDKDGVATFTVSGTNTKATPIVFADVTAEGGNNNDKLDATELQAAAPQVTFGGAQVSNKIEITAQGTDHVATTEGNGRVYKLAVTDKDGKAYANGVVNVALNEKIDRNSATDTAASIKVKASDDSADPYKFGQQLAGIGEATIQVRLNSKGEAELVLWSDKVNDYATPVVWIDQNASTNNQTGYLESGEPNKVGAITYFETAEVKSSELKVYKAGGDNKEYTKTFNKGEVAEFRYTALNQSGKAITANLEASFEVTNNSGTVVTVKSADGSSTLATIQAYGRETVKFSTTNAQASITVETDGTSDANVTVNANAYVKGTSKYLGNQTATAKFSKYGAATLVSGLVKDIDAVKKEFTVTEAGKDYRYSYVTGTYQLNGNNVSRTGFEDKLVGADVIVTKAADGALTFNIVTAGTAVPTAPTALTFTSTAVKTGDNVNISTVPANTTAYLAPAGTTNFVAGPKITSAAVGATQIAAPADEGTYQLFLVDGFGRTVVSSGTVTVDNTAPTATITNAVYNVTNDTITLTGTNFTTAGTTATDVKAQLDWTKLAISADNAGTVTAQTVGLADVTSAVITNNTTLTITLAGAKATALEAAFGTLNATDTLAVSAGFVKDAAGNVATTDALSANALDN